MMVLELTWTNGVKIPKLFSVKPQFGKIPLNPSLPKGEGDMLQVRRSQLLPAFRKRGVGGFRSDDHSVREKY